ncbi:hypothetical protein [Pseudomonas morbosilactucae]|uniref:hypothetical protein n=1 Tax=Pseudomonas morbosilactucae TaxID=2938197 RepID=UPI003CC6BE87
MRLKLLTNLNTLLLVAVCLALGATLWWSQRALERPYLLMERYLGLSQQFQNQAARNIEDYLASGDALRLSAASQALETLQAELSELPGELAQSLRPSLASLDDFSKTDLLAAGKLAGDPQALLLQAERELGANLEQLSQYAGDASPASAAPYLPLLLSASQHLGKLSLARDKLVSSGRSELAADVERELSNMRQQAERLGALPLLGVAGSSASGTDDFAAMMGLENTEKAASEDAGVGLKRELHSLLGRYPAELGRTREQIQKRADLSAATHLKITAVRQALAELEPVVRAQHGQIQGEVRLMQGLMIGLILLIALVIDSLQRKLARVLTNLAPALSTWATATSAKTFNWARPTANCMTSKPPSTACGPTWWIWWAPFARTPSKWPAAAAPWPTSAAACTVAPSARPATPRKSAMPSASWKPPSSKWPVMPARRRTPAAVPGSPWNRGRKSSA